ncbi:MAG: glycosyltransferase, partial [Limnohabitans sp.]
MSLRVLHVLDHSIPLHSGYTFRTLSLLREQRKLGWDTHHLTSPKHGAGLAGKDAQIAATATATLEETVDGWHFFRTPQGSGSFSLPGLGELQLMGELERRLQQVAEQLRPQIIHAHSPVLNALPALKVGRRLGIPVVYEVR